MQDTSDEIGPVFHRPQTHPVCRGKGIETAPIIFDLQEKFAVVVFQPDMD